MWRDYWLRDGGRSLSKCVVIYVSMLLGNVVIFFFLIDCCDVFWMLCCRWRNYGILVLLLWGWDFVEFLVFGVFSWLLSVFFEKILGSVWFLEVFEFMCFLICGLVWKLCLLLMMVEYCVCVCFVFLVSYFFFEGLVCL